MIAHIGGVAQLVEQRDHNPFVGGSSPSSAMADAKTQSPVPGQHYTKVALYLYPSSHDMARGTPCESTLMMLLDIFTSARTCAVYAFRHQERNTVMRGLMAC